MASANGLHMFVFVVYPAAQWRQLAAQQGCHRGDEDNQLHYRDVTMVMKTTSCTTGMSPWWWRQPAAQQGCHRGDWRQLAAQQGCHHGDEDNQLHYRDVTMVMKTTSCTTGMSPWRLKTTSCTTGMSPWWLKTFLFNQSQNTDGMLLRDEFFTFAMYKLILFNNIYWYL